MRTNHILKNLLSLFALIPLFLAIKACAPVESAQTPLPTGGGETVQETVPTTDEAPARGMNTPVGTSQRAAETIKATPPGMVRASAIAGSWYPDDPEELTTMIDQMLAGAVSFDGDPIALLVPHAGYIYSGPIAAQGFKQMEGRDYEVAVIIATDHQAPLSKSISVWAEGGFETPLGIVPVDVELAEALVNADERISFDPKAHENEHPIEIELPFLQRVCPGCHIVPVLMGDDEQESVDALTEALVSALKGKKALIIASSDLSHYPAYEEAAKIDSTTLAAIETGSATLVQETTRNLVKAGYKNLATCACGEAPILVAMQTASELGADTITVLGYANSGDSPYGDKTQVVGYGAVMFWNYEPPNLSTEQQGALLDLARSTLDSYLNHGEIPAYESDDPSLSRKSGAFVTLKQDGDLRGCIGHTSADLPLPQTIQQSVISAASEDPRFPPLKADELDGIQIEISLISPFKRITDIESIEVGKHGLLISMSGKRGLLLPQVPVEQGWDREAYLVNLCLKASLDENCYAQNPSLYTFTAQVFAEQ